jgi:hypothetical protein
MVHNSKNHAVIHHFLVLWSPLQLHCKKENGTDKVSLFIQDVYMCIKLDKSKKCINYALEEMTLFNINIIQKHKNITQKHLQVSIKYP